MFSPELSVIDELHRIGDRKFPNKIRALDAFPSCALLILDFVPTPEANIEQKRQIGDVKDRPILCTVLNADVDALLTVEKMTLNPTWFISGFCCCPVPYP